MLLPPTAALPVPPATVVVENEEMALARFLPPAGISASVHGEAVPLEFRLSATPVRDFGERKAVDDFLHEIGLLEQSDPDVPEMPTALAESLWSTVQDEYGTSLPVPLVAAGEDGGIMFSWDEGPHHLSVEMLKHRIEVFYRDRRDDARSVYREMSDQDFFGITEANADLFGKLAFSF